MKDLFRRIWLGKVVKVISDPGLAMHWLRFNAFGYIFRLDPTGVNLSQAERFFAPHTSSNVKLIQACTPYLRRATTSFDVGGNAGFFP